MTSVRAVIDEAVACLARGNTQFGSSQMWRNFPDQVAEQLRRGILLNYVSSLFDPSELRIGEP